MVRSEFEREITRLRNHYGDRHYSNEISAILWEEFQNIPDGSFRKMVLEAIATMHQGRPPLREEFKKLAEDIGINARRTPSWKYLEVQDCMRCGGIGWHFIYMVQGGEGVAACADCLAGKNLQVAPRPHISFTQAQCPGATYSRPGRVSSCVMKGIRAGEEPNAT